MLKCVKQRDVQWYALMDPIFAARQAMTD